MSNVFDKLLAFLGVREEYEYEDNPDLFNAEVGEDIIPLRQARSRRGSDDNRGQSKPTLVSLTGGQKIQAKMYILEPLAFEDVKDYVVHLKNGRSLILRVHRVDKSEAQRIVDFMSGAAHALNGNMRKLGETIFCFAPPSVVIEGDVESDFFKLSDE